MRIRIGSRIVYGTIMPHQQAARALHAVRTHYAGLDGESEITIGVGSRPIDIPVIIHRRFTQAQLIRVLRLLQSGSEASGWIGVHGTVEIEADAIRRKYDNMTFDGFDLLEGPLPDIAGTLSGGWFAEGVLRFTQLK